MSELLLIPLALAVILLVCVHKYPEFTAQLKLPGVSLFFKGRRRSD